MSAVELEARELLRWFPNGWRRDHGEALIGTLLDAAEAAGRDQLTTGERRDLILSGIRERGVAIVPEEARRHAAPIALGVGTTLAGLQLIVVEWAPWSSRDWEGLSPVAYEFGPFTSAGVVIDVLWLVAFMLGLLRLRRAMIGALAGSVLTSVVLYFAPLSSWSIGRPVLTAMAVMALLAVTASSAPLTARRFRPAAILAAGLSAATVVSVMWGNFPHSGFSASSSLFRNFNPIAVGAVLLIAVAAPTLIGLHHTAQAILVALGPSWVVLLARAQAEQAQWLLVVAVAILVVLLIEVSSRIRWRIERPSRSTE